MKRILFSLTFLGLLLAVSCKKDNTNPSQTFQLSSVKIGNVTLDLAAGAANTGIPVDQSIVAAFSDALDVNTVPQSFLLLKGNDTIPVNYSYVNSNMVSAKPLDVLTGLTSYEIVISNKLKSTGGTAFNGASILFTTVPPAMKVDSFSVDGKSLLTSSRVTDVDRNFSCYIHFDHPLDESTLTSSSVLLSHIGYPVTVNWVVSNDKQALTLTSPQPLVHFDKHTIALTNEIKGADGATFTTLSKDFYSAIDPTPKFPEISDDELLTLVQQQTFRFFYDYAHPACGMARERNTSGNIVTSGGSGFGIMALIVGMERGFITRQQGTDRLTQILTFLEDAGRYHGVWPHWMDGNTGDIVHFNPDDGGDPVETSYLMMGLLTMRQYLNASDPDESTLISRINALWQSVEWDWYTNGQNTLYWNWSEVLGFQFPFGGYNETLITYLLAAASPTHAIDAAVYHNGWAHNGTIVNGNSYYGFVLPMGESYGGPLFFEQYTYLGFNPTNLTDQYGNYWEQCTNHTLINRAYCIDNPKKWVGYSQQCWGLTASDNQSGYSAHSPTNDLGVITPTAALSSFPYTPVESMEALKFFYYTIGDKIWGDQGFVDAFNVTSGWWDKEYIAIDQGPIIGMIENYRTGLLWNLFMSCPEVTDAMNKLGFSN
jgi:hypothetical protein